MWHLHIWKNLPHKQGRKRFISAQKTKTQIQQYNILINQNLCLTFWKYFLNFASSLPKCKEPEGLETEKKEN
jgi:hypothetical protein